jgi:transcriptional regulator of heat shock response
MTGDLDKIVHELEIGLINLRSHVDLQNQKVQADINTLVTALNELKEKQQALSDGVKDQNEENIQVFVSNERYRPVEKIVLGGAGLVLIAVLTAVVALVLR